LIEPRLASSVQVSAFIRLAQSGGDFAAVLRKGDHVAGAIILIGLVRGKDPVVFERFPSIDGGSPWQQIDTNSVKDDTNVTAQWKKRAERDPDLWVIELNVVSPERLGGLLAAAT